jgi:ethanolamine ammonia-lyase small subunit
LARHRRISSWDLTFVIADGLSGAAVAEHALPVVLACLPRLAGWKLSPIVLASQARVALGDEIAQSLNSQMCVVLIGERPGLSVSNSLGAYVTWNPRSGHKDADRNCISNIHSAGLGYEPAAHAICWILEQARRHRCSGTAIKNEAACANVGVFAQ